MRCEEGGGGGGGGGGRGGVVVTDLGVLIWHFLLDMVELELVI